MIYGKLWLVVKPSVGIPLLLGAVAVSSFAVHYMLVTNTTWLKKYFEGNTATATKAALAPPVATDTLVAIAPTQKP